MGFETCRLISYRSISPAVIERLQYVFGPEKITIEGSAEAWTRIDYLNKKLLRKATISIFKMPDAQLPTTISELQHIFRIVPAEKPEVLSKLLLKIGTSKNILELQAPNGFRGLEEFVFELAKAIDAVIFWQENKMLDHAGNLILDFDGQVGIGEFNVEADASLLDSGLKESQAALDRKQRSIDFLQSKDIPFTPSLPIIPDEEEAQIRAAATVLDRALCLLPVALKGAGMPIELTSNIVRHFGLTEALSPSETAFLGDAQSEQQQMINFAWRYESLWTLLWALGLVEELAFPNAVCDVNRIFAMLSGDATKASLTEKMKFRSPTEILDAADLIYRLNWACTNARLKGQQPPARMHPGIVYERHYALNWLRSYLDLDWDDVRADT